MHSFMECGQIIVRVSGQRVVCRPGTFLVYLILFCLFQVLLFIDSKSPFLGDLWCIAGVFMLLHAAFIRTYEAFILAFAAFYIALYCILYCPRPHLYCTRPNLFCFHNSRLTAVFLKWRLYVLADYHYTASYSCCICPILLRL